MSIPNSRTLIIEDSAPQKAIKGKMKIKVGRFAI